MSDGLLLLITKRWRDSRHLLSSGFNVCGPARTPNYGCDLLSVRVTANEFKIGVSLTKSIPPSVFLFSNPRICLTHLLPAVDTNLAALWTGFC